MCELPTSTSNKLPAPAWLIACGILQRRHLIMQVWAVVLVAVNGWNVVRAMVLVAVNAWNIVVQGCAGRASLPSPQTAPWAQPPGCSRAVRWWADPTHV
eukprot:364597-Chlamydomonas_euryale.AAC.18